MNKKIIFITGGAGFIGAPTASRLATLGYPVIVYDSARSTKNHGRGVPLTYIQGDIRDSDMLQKEMKKCRPNIVLHLAAKTSVIESEKQKKLYEEVNVTGTKNVLLAMKRSGCTKIVFASSASVYGLENTHEPEETLLLPLNVYAQTKVEDETLITADTGFTSVILRYFNVVGATNDGLFGEDIQGNSKLIPSILRVGLGMEKAVVIYGKDYPTPDGTAIRDYVSLEDVVRANIQAVRYLLHKNSSIICNIGSCVPTSNLTAVRAVEKQLHRDIPVVFKLSREETMISVAANGKAKKFLKWEPRYSALHQIINGLVSFQNILHL